MKIWFPTIRGNSGTDIYTRRLADALQRRGIATEITWFPASYQFAPFLLQWTSPPPGTSVIHANTWNAFAFRSPGIPLVVTEHHCVFDPEYRYTKSRAQRLFHETIVARYERASLRMASAIVAVSHFTKSSLARSTGIDSAQVIHNWVDIKQFTPGICHAHSGKRPFRLLFIGNLSTRKGADLLAPIMKELGPEFELQFTYGLRGPKRLWATQNMRSLGRLTEDRELVEAYRKCDALLFPTRFEGFGLVALEAMACGKPVIATNVSAVPEIVKDRTTGILCPPDNVRAFVAACRELADDPATASRYGQSARRHAVEMFSEERILPQYIELYTRLISER